MLILNVIPSMNPLSGGPCQGIRNIDQALQKQGIFREVVSLDDSAASFLGKDSFPIHALGVPRTGWQYNKTLLPWLLENMQRFDMVIVNGMWLYHTYAVVKAWKTLNKYNKKGQSKKAPPIFIMPHGMLDPYFQKSPDRKLKAIRNWMYWKLIEKKNVEAADGLLFTCQLEMELARQSFSPYNPKKELNIGYGVVDLPAHIPAMTTAFLNKCPTLKNSNFILSLSRIHIKKGIDILIEAYGRLYMEMKTYEDQKNLPKLVIAGPGMDTDYGQKLKALIESYPGIENNLFFPGMLTDEAKLGALYGCEAFVLASHQENFGIAVVEALACKAPVLITNQVNIWKEIAEGNAGFVEPDTISGIEKMLRKWVGLKPEKKNIFKTQARNTFEKYFTINIASENFVQTFSQ